MRTRRAIAAVGAAAAIVAAARVAGRRRAFVATSVAARNARLAAIGTRAGARHAIHRVRVAGAPAERRAALDVAHQMRTASDVAVALGEMKGALMKLGQMVSYLDDGLPAPVRE